MLDMSKWYIRLGTWAFNLFLLNILWFTFSLMGLFIIGAFPATAALFAVLRRSIMEDNDIPVLKLFLINFKSEFIKSNFLGYIILIVGFVLYLDFRVLGNINIDLLQVVLTSVTVVISIVYLLAVLYIFPVFVHFNMKLWQYPKSAVILAVGRPLYTLMMVALLSGIVYLCLHITVLIPIAGVSLSCYIIMKIAALSLPKKSSLRSSKNETG